MGGCQNYGPLSGPLNTRCRITVRSHKGTIILTTTLICVPFFERAVSFIPSFGGRSQAPQRSGRPRQKAARRGQGHGRGWDQGFCAYRQNSRALIIRAPKIWTPNLWKQIQMYSLYRTLCPPLMWPYYC